MDIEWGDGISWGEVNRQAEKEFSVFHFESANTSLYFELFQNFEREAVRMLEEDLVLPAYDYAVKLSHIFNVLDARGAISVTERTGYIARIRGLARRVAVKHLEKRESMGFPLVRGTKRK
jgi:glycyl-tRNA synthetase alpha chain